MRHPTQVLFAGKRPFPMMPAVDHYAGSEKLLLEGTPGAADAYLNFLKAGSSVYPVEALKLAGVDMTTPEAVERTFAVLAGYVDRLASLTG